MGTEGVIISEGLKFLIMLAFQEARKAGATKEQLDELYFEEKRKFQENDPAKIPDPGGAT